MSKGFEMTSDRNLALNEKDNFLNTINYKMKCLDKKDQYGRVDKIYIHIFFSSLNENIFNKSYGVRNSLLSKRFTYLEDNNTFSC